MRKQGFRFQVLGFSLIAAFAVTDACAALTGRTLQEGVYRNLDGVCASRVRYPVLDENAAPEALVLAFNESVKQFAEIHACTGRKESGLKKEKRASRTVSYRLREHEGALTVWMERVDTLPGRRPMRVAAERFELDAARGNLKRTVEQLSANLLPAADPDRDKGDKLYQSWRLTPRDYRE